MIIRYIKGMFKLGLIVIGVLTVLVALFLFFFSYTSPVREAGRDFKKDIRSYRRADIETVDDVYARLEVLDSHYNSPTHDKVQDADKTEITQTDIQTLFGKPHEVVEDAQMSGANTVYRYFYDELVVNFHELSYQNVDEYVTEQFNGVFYDETALDELFIEAINNHQTQTNKVDGQFERLPKEKATQLIKEQVPTRNVRQIGWYTWSYNQHDYFDDGSGDYAPVEYLSFQYEENEVPELALIERHYNIPALTADAESELEKQQEDVDQEEESKNKEEKIRLGDFIEDYGKVWRMNYEVKEGVLYVSWFLNDGEFPKERIATVPVTEPGSISEISELAELEVVDIDSRFINDLNQGFKNDAFIGSQK